jgi:Tfp pilus assembly protein PilE
VGGLGVWTAIDFFISVFGKYTDSKGQYIDKKYSLLLVVILIIAFCLALVLVILGAIALPQYAKERVGADENQVEAAYYQVQIAEEVYFAQHLNYTEDISALREEADLTIYPDVSYEELTTYTKNDTPCYMFVVRSRKNPSNAYSVDSCGDPTVNKL